MEDTIMEIWKPVENNSHILVSSLGRIKRLKGRNKGIQSNFSKDKDGYCKINIINENGKWTQTSIHRLVAKAFIDNPENKPCVNHINGKRDDNRVENLEWVTEKENVRHSFLYGQRKRCFEIPQIAILTEYQISQIDILRNYYTVNQIAKLFNIKYQSLKNVIRKMKQVKRLDNQQPSIYNIYEGSTTSLDDVGLK